jgi:hypothetical protein
VKDIETLKVEGVGLNLTKHQEIHEAPIVNITVKNVLYFLSILKLRIIEKHDMKSVEYIGNAQF